MTWLDSYALVEPLVAIPRGSRRATVLARELALELSDGHALHGRSVLVVGEATPQDDVLVVADQQVYLVHLTWSGHPETPPWPTTRVLTGPDELESVVQSTY